MTDAAMTDAFADRTALVTGGTRGLGRAIADRLAGHGARIAIVDHPDALAAVDLPAGWQGFPCDLAAADAEAAALAAAAAVVGPHILIANAGVVPPWRSIADQEMAEWDRVMRINATGMALTLKAFTPGMAAAGGGTVVMMASLNSHKAHPSQALYTASKHAVLGLMRAAALDLGRYNIRVNALCPGPIATPALEDRIAVRHAKGGPAPAEAFAGLAAETALGRIATMADVADAACYLAGPASGGITGVGLPIDAGLA